MSKPDFIADLKADSLRAMVSYDPDTGVFTRLVSKARAKVGDVMGVMDPSGYVLIPLNNRLYRAHRLAWLYMTGSWPVEFIDHIDRNRANNSWKNLREASATVNAQNSSLRSDNKSGVKGVTWCNTHHKWLAQIRVDRRTKYLGLFTDLTEAAEVRARAEDRLHPFFTKPK